MDQGAGYCERSVGYGDVGMTRRPPFAAPADKIVGGLNKLSKTALSAAMRGGTAAWGMHGSSAEHIRYAEAIKSRKKCTCGCDGRRTHAGMANGVCLTSGCELSVYRWVKTGSKTAKQKEARP